MALKLSLEDAENRAYPLEYVSKYLRAAMNDFEHRQAVADGFAHLQAIIDCFKHRRVALKILKATQ